MSRENIPMLNTKYKIRDTNTKTAWANYVEFFVVGLIRHSRALFGIALLAIFLVYPVDAQNARKPMSRSMQSRAFLELGQLDTQPARAAQFLNRVVSLKQGHEAEAYLELGELYLLAADYGNARTYLLDASRFYKNRFGERAAFLVANSYYAEGKYVEAREAFADYLLAYLDGKYQAQARFGIALSNEEIGREREAAEIYKAILEQHQNMAEEPWIIWRLVNLTGTKKFIANFGTSERAKYSDLLKSKFPTFSPPQDGTILLAAARSKRRSGKASDVVELPPSQGSPTKQVVLSSVETRIKRPVASDVTVRTKTTVTPKPKPVVVKPVAKSPVKKSPSKKTSRSGRYFVQVGAFGVLGNAEALVNKLKSGGFMARIQPRGKLSLVQVGPFLKRKDAESQRDDIKSIAGTRGFINVSN
ncbi:MAG: SPOR domain-containing protein [Candidatus Lindowbacteria bacterium]|nr:SPOR domain-containing protein [Candidatus Lindowbacteria bacterium]